MAGEMHRLAYKMKEESTHLENEIFELPKREVSIPGTTTIHKFNVGNYSISHKGIENKVVMIMGASGAGKSTLINAMVNYILGVNRDNPFRLKLVVDEVTTQTRSVTKDITVYTMHAMEGSRIPYSLTIVDTPGFDDTDGLERDKMITQQIKELFSLKDGNGIDHLDAVGVVTQASSV